MNQKPTYEELEQRVKYLENKAISQNKTKHQPIDTEAICRLMLENISDTVILTDDLGNMVYVCPNTTVIFGFSPEEIYAQQTIQKFMNGSICDITEIKRKGKIENIERSIKKSSGDERTLLISVKSVNIKDGTILYVIRDITDRKIAEKQIEKYKHIVSSTIDGIALLDRNYRYIIINDAYEKFLGIDRSEFIGKTVSEHLSEDIFIKYIKDNFDRSLQGEIVNYQEWFEYPTLGRRLLDITYSPYQGSANQISGIIAVTRDITNSKKAEDAINKSEEQFRKQFESSPIPTFVWNVRDGQFFLKEVNNAADVLTHGESAQFLGISANKIYSDRFDILKHFQDCITNKKNIVINTEYLPHNTGLKRQIIFTFVYISNEILMLHAEDISERMLAEKSLKENLVFLQTLIDAIPIPLFYKDVKGKYLGVNNEFGSFFGKKREDIIGKTLHALGPKHFADKYYEKDQELFQCPGNQVFESKVMNAAGETRDVIFNKATYSDSEGKTQGLIGTISDITKLKKTQNQLRKKDQQLTQAQKMEAIGNLAGGIAHDFNNILSSIIGYTELVLDAAPEGSSQRDDLEEVYIAGNRAKELVKQILAFARQSEEKTKPVKPSDIITEVLKLLRPSTPTTIDIKSTINSTAKVMGNASQLHQVIMNLCTNAIHSLQKSGGVLEIGLRDSFVEKDSKSNTSELSAGEYVELTVTDNGAGIKPVIIENIFDPYFTTKEVGKGTGMGLAMVKGIIDSYRGDIRVKSEPEEKTSFVIRLPVTTGKSFGQLGQADPVALGTERILFVDDEPPIARMVNRLLDSLGYTVTIQSSSVEALELFKEKPGAFDLVITDFTMPSMTGDVLSMEIRKIRPDIPIILCTGYSNIINDERAKQLGIDAFTYKPITKPDLAKTVREVLDTNRSSSV